jgi:hypothetical protein
MGDFTKVITQVFGLVAGAIGVALYVTYYRSLQGAVATGVIVAVTLAACGGGFSRAALRYRRRRREEEEQGGEQGPCISLSPWAEFKYDLTSVAAFLAVVAIGAWQTGGLGGADLVQGGAAFVALLAAKRTLLVSSGS